MTAAEHAPIIVPYGDTVDGVVLRCGCGCGLYQTHGTREAAERARDEAEQ